MKKLLLLALAISLSAACSTVEPDAGVEAVLVRKPMLFGKGGIDPTPVQTGLTYTAVTTSAVYVSMLPRQQQYHFDDLFTSDSVPLDFDATVQYRINDSVRLVKEFGADDGPAGMGFFIRTTSQPFMNAVRDAVKKHGLNEMATSTEASKSVDNEITEVLREVIKEKKLPVDLLGVSLGRANPPDAIKHQRIATAEQEQRINTERQRKLAEDVRRSAEESRAIADRAYNDKMGLDPAQYLQLKQIETLRDVCGGGKCTFVSAGTPLVNVK